MQREFFIDNLTLVERIAGEPYILVTITIHIIHKHLFLLKGDSGGPLNLDGTTYGVTSFVASAGCESGLPHGFTRVTYFLDWIQANSGVTP